MEISRDQVLGCCAHNFRTSCTYLFGNQPNQIKIAKKRIVVWITIFSSMTITFAPANVYFASSPNMPIGMCLPSPAAGWSIGMWSLQCFQNDATSAVFQEIFRFSLAMNAAKAWRAILWGKKCQGKRFFLYITIDIYIYICSKKNKPKTRGDKVAQQFMWHHHRNPHSGCGTLCTGLQIFDGNLHKVQCLKW